MRIAFLTTEGRAFSHQYDGEVPWFGTAPKSLLDGFAQLTKKSPGGIAENIEIHVISCSQKLMRSPAKLSENIWFHSLHVPKWGWLKAGYLGCVLAVQKKLREIQPDIVHAQGTERDCAISAIGARCPKILTIHGNLRLIRKTVGLPLFSALWFQSLLEGLVVPRFDGIVCITNYTKNAVKHEAKATWVIPNAVDAAFFNAHALDAAPSSSGIPVILVVANIDERKNQNAFIRALDSVALDQTFKVKFFGRSGNNSYGREFEALISKRAWCHYGGMLGREALRAEFEKASILALPSHEENCPMVVLEAQAAGVPVMASNAGGVPDLVEDGVTGLLTNPQRLDTMSDAIRRLLEDKPLVEKLRKNAYLQAQKSFHPLVVARQHIKVYSGLLAAAKN